VRRFSTNHKVVDLRGNVNTRIQKKLHESDWVELFCGSRTGKNQLKIPLYDWMIPAPAQGAMVVVAMANDEFCRQALNELNDIDTEDTHIERQFLKPSKAVVRHQLAL
jgi:hydroxymethylbilane synthase